MTVKANLSKTFDIFEFENLLDEDGGITPLSKVQIQPIELSFIPCKAYDFNANVSYKGVIRAAENLHRGKNVLEYDDKVKFYNVASNREFLIKNPGNQFSYCKKVFGINYSAEDGESYSLIIDNGVIDILKVSENIHDFKAWLAKVLQGTDPKDFLRKDYQLYFQNIKKKDDKIFIVADKKEKLSLEKINLIRIKSVDL